MLGIFRKVAQLPLLVHCGAGLVTVWWFQWVKGKLDASYAASLHPVDYATGQTTFSGTQVKSYYAAMLDSGTLDIYLRTQLIDFGFILAFFGIGLFLCTLLARLGRDPSLSRTLGLLAGVAIVAGGVSDAIENLWSFVMLADPRGFADWLAIAYSSFAVLKFALITAGMGLALACVVAAGLGRVLGKPSIG